MQHQQSHSVRLHHATPPLTGDAAVIARLQHNLAESEARNATLTRDLGRAAAAPTVVAVLPGPDRFFTEIVFLSNGIRLERRWDDTAGWHYRQGEDVPTTLAAILDGLFADPRAVPPVARREMAVTK